MPVNLYIARERIEAYEPVIFSGSPNHVKRQPAGSMVCPAGTTLHDVLPFHHVRVITPAVETRVRGMLIYQSYRD